MIGVLVPSQAPAFPILLILVRVSWSAALLFTRSGGTCGTCPGHLDSCPFDNDKLERAGQDTPL